MKSSAKLYFGILIWAAGLMAAITISKHGTDDYWLPFLPALIVGGFAYWLGGFFLAESMRPEPVDFGELLLDHLQYEINSSSQTWIHVGMWSAYSIVKSWLKNGTFFSQELFLIVFVGWPIACFAVFASPVRHFKQMKIPTGGFAIHERGIRLARRTFNYDVIVSADCNAASGPAHPGKLRIRLRHEIVDSINTKISEKEAEEVMSLLSCLIADGQKDELAEEQGKTESALAV